MGRHHRSIRTGGPFAFPRRWLAQALLVVLLFTLVSLAMAGIDRSGNVALVLPPPPADAAESLSPPCPPEVRACVALGVRQAWLRDADGTVIFGPVPMTAGSDDLPTPAGNYTVQRKDIDHVSSIYGTPMPFAVFFDDRGYAFHEGDLTQQSAGCIRLGRAAAERFYNELNIGDAVQIVA